MSSTRPCTTLPWSTTGAQASRRSPEEDTDPVTVLPATCGNAAPVLKLLVLLLNCQNMKFQRSLFHPNATDIQQRFDYSLCLAVQIVGLSSQLGYLHCSTPAQNPLPSGFCWPRGPTNPRQKDVWVCSSASKQISANPKVSKRKTNLTMAGRA